ncbi:DNAJ domain-containing protein [Pseudomassariella vexata]|uniref:DNAJ domain-containing protein n=1 Tax=Pseudomassariella vexata TaxID=1141098 RepID=A0A1Y2DLW6_9PEZI|nr:DNAJ domain-containing protein [Pseudomassariella vexata]ORY60250.1 DNAJ domain-containing protein [Pseudomassariella vexata]
MSGTPPNYYKILEVSESATTQQIRDAYKRAALKTHPDRVPTDSPERERRTRKFQLVNDAYYTLSDPARRREYDAQRKMYGFTGGNNRKSAGGGASYSDPFDDADIDEEVPLGGAAGAGAGAQSFPSWAWNFFMGTKDPKNTQQARQETEQEQFSDVFEEMLREQGLAGENNKPTGRFWGVAGAASGGVLGFILANFPGLMAGAVAGNRLGAIRDAKGKSVYEVFQALPQAERATLLTQLAAKVFSHTVGA